MKRKTLSGKQSRFVEAYIETRFNGTQAAIQAGYSEKTASQQAFENLRKPEIQEAIAAEVEERSKALGFLATRERVIQELCSIAFANPADFFEVDQIGLQLKPLEEIPEHLRGAIANVSQKKGSTRPSMTVRFHPKLAALDQLARVLGLYSPEKVEATLTSDSTDFSEIFEGLTREEQEILGRALSSFPEN